MPTLLTSLLGREQEVAILWQLLKNPDIRFHILTSPGLANSFGAANSGRNGQPICRKGRSLWI
ncbi:MAG: hypothetical protein IPL28_18195 [Chloroflexi bacterium]|nr:hypothetical protein [Chloroflexota bacterium]